MLVLVALSVRLSGQNGVVPVYDCEIDGRNKEREVKRRRFKTYDVAEESSKVRDRSVRREPDLHAFSRCGPITSTGRWPALLVCRRWDHFSS